MKKILLSNIQDTIIVIHSTLGFSEGQPLTLVDHFKYVEGSHAYVKVYLPNNNRRCKYFPKKYVKIFKVEI